MKKLTREQALCAALEYARIANDETRCLLGLYADGLYRFVVRTPYQRYEFYVDAESGEVLGIDAQPLPYRETLIPLFRGTGFGPAAA